MSPLREVLRDSSGDSGSESENASGSSRTSRSVSPVSHERIPTPSNVRCDHSEDENELRSPMSTGRSSRSSVRTSELNKSEDGHKLQSPSPTRSGSRYSSPESVQSDKSGSQRSRSASPKSVASNSTNSQQSPRSHSPSPHGIVRSESSKSLESPKSNRSVLRSPNQNLKTATSPTSNTSPYESPKSHRSTSPQSDKSIRSGSQNSHISRRSNLSESSKNDHFFTGGDKSEEKSDSEASKLNTHSKSVVKTAESENIKENKIQNADNNETIKSDDSDAEVNTTHRRENSNSTAEVAKSIKKISTAINSDSDNEVPDKVKGDIITPTADALFGDASDISTDDEKDKRETEERKKSRSRSRSPSKSRSRSRSRSQSRARSDSGGEGPSHQAVIEDDDDKDKEEDPEPPPETRIDVEIPKITTDLGREIHFVKLPNFLSVETRPFDHETYEDEIDEEETLDEEGRARLKLKVENTLRWKETFSDEGKVVKESNARFVKWSDGSMSLHLGSEIFDVYKQPLQGDHNHLYIRQGTGLQGQAVFRTKLTFRPHSTESFTHRKMTMSLADRSQKTSGIKVLSQVGMNPDQNRYEMIKKEEEKLRMAMRVQSKTKKSNAGSRSSGRVSGGYGADVYHDDGSDDEGAISLAAIKNKYKKGGATISAKAASNIYSSDEEGSDFETVRPKKNIKGKVLKDSDDESNSESASGSGRDDNQADNASD